MKQAELDRAIELMVDMTGAIDAVARDGRITKQETEYLKEIARDAVLSAQLAKMNQLQGIEVLRRGMEAVVDNPHYQRQMTELARRIEQRAS